MLKKALLGLTVAVGALVTVLAVALLGIRNDLHGFAEYWQARAAEPGEFVYVALGDSAAQGIGASTPDKGYVGLLAAEIHRKTGRQVRVVNLSVSGARLRDLADHQLAQLANYTPDLITMEIGANDMRAYQPEEFRRQYQQILQALPAERTVISTMPFFGGRIRLADSPAQASRTIQDVAGQRGFRVAELYEPLKAANNQWIYAADWFHPNDRGYRIWYEAFWPHVSDILMR